ncbi:MULTISPECIES: DUF6049 family protein [unclassified Amycolatopsis]|uniref:DUF6049 family protein n=1 Tax=unclassified Amycolatopsis TaxID=2618356 RepID=UPI00287698F9|nr:MULTISPECIES: DUF6049 family protein [unclassified Amycolatopsis]MDS0133093.1 glycoprotein [Amycolatopsis sp. 505]MDS0142082.1 glycoprotein [Amycolatopsis sp. CM201R]
MKRFAAAFLSVLFLAVPALAGATVAQAQEGARLRIDLAGLSPRVITTSTTTLTVTGTVTNTGDRRVAKPQVRLQVGDRATTERGVGDVLSGAVVKDTPLTEFTSVADVLEPGQSAPLNLTVPLTGARAERFARPGVYPLLVNVNGTPEFGGPARLGAVSMLMPVLTGPGKQATSRGGAPSMTLLWPLTGNIPHVYAAPYGSPLVLADDRLAGEISGDGRLNALVTSAASAVRNNSNLAKSMCFALDPDLLATVDAMTRGYLVHTDTGNVDGKGAEAAKAWLTELRALVGNRCVVALPFADTDLDALTRIRPGDTSLVTRAATGAATIQELTDVAPQTGVLWPDGTPSASVLTALSEAGVRTVLTDAGKLPPAAAGGGVTVQGSTVRLQPTDSLISAAMTGVPTVPGSVTVPATTERAVASQNGLGALAFRAGLGQTGGQRPDHLLVAPPRRWDASAEEFTTYLQQVSDFLSSGVVTATGLPALLAAEPSAAGAVGDSGTDPAAGVDAGVVSTLAGLDVKATGLASAMQLDPTKRVKPDDVVEPIRLAELRGASTAWRGLPADAATTNAQAEVAAISGRVTVSQPKQTIALASGNSPLPVYVSNDLPVGINARFTLNNNTGLRPEDAKDWFFPASGGKNYFLPVEALRAGRFSVDVSLSTPTGTPLGSSARFELTSTEYGAITIIATVAAGVALLLLASRRIYRRVKDARAGRDVVA